MGKPLVSQYSWLAWKGLERISGASKGSEKGEVPFGFFGYKPLVRNPKPAPCYSTVGEPQPSTSPASF